MIINVKEVVAKVALANRQHVEADDPIMALITIMTVIGEAWQATMDESLQHHLSEHESMANRWRKNTPAQVNKVIDAALTAGKDVMAKTMSEGAEKVMKIVREREQHLLHEIMSGALEKQKAELAAATEKFKEEFRRYYLWMLAGNVGVMVLALIVAAWLWSSIFPVFRII